MVSTAETVEAKLTASYTLAITTATNQLNGNILAVSNRVETLQASFQSLDGKVNANAQAVSSLDTRVTQANGKIAANATAITGLQSSYNDVSADALFKAETAVFPGGGWSTIGLRTRVTTGTYGQRQRYSFRLSPMAQAGSSSMRKSFSSGT